MMEMTTLLKVTSGILVVGMMMALWMLYAIMSILEQIAATIERQARH